MALQIADCVQAGLCRGVVQRRDHFFSGLGEDAISYGPDGRPQYATTSRTRPATYPGGGSDPRRSAGSGQIAESTRSTLTSAVKALDSAPTLQRADEVVALLVQIPSGSRWTDSSWWSGYWSWGELYAKATEIQARMRRAPGSPPPAQRASISLPEITAGIKGPMSTKDGRTYGSVPSPVPDPGRPGKGVLAESLDSLASLFSAVGPAVPGIVELTRKPGAVAPYPTSAPPRSVGSEWLLPLGALAAGAAVLYFATKGR